MAQVALIRISYVALSTAMCASADRSDPTTSGFSPLGVQRYAVPKGMLKKELAAQLEKILNNGPAPLLLTNG